MAANSQTTLGVRPILVDAPYLLQVRAFVDRLLEKVAPHGPFTGLRVRAAIIAVVSQSERSLSVTEIRSALIAGGFRSASKNLSVQVNNSCNALASNGQLIEERRGERKFFKPAAQTRGATKKGHGHA